MARSRAVAAMDRVDESRVRPLRADAKRNRDKVLAAARTAFADDGADASLESIARTAEVGIGTLYRHFPTRLDLLAALYQDDLDCLTAASEDTSRSPWDGLVAWIDLFLEFGSTKRALLAELADSQSDSSAFQSCRDQLLEAAERVMQRAKDAGEVRQDVGRVDVTRLVGGVSLSRGVPLEDGKRLARIVLAGIRPA